MRGNRRLEGMTDGQASDRAPAEQKESRRVAAVSSSTSPFGQNEWLVEEMYRKFREDPSSVDPSWHEFLVDYSPESTAGDVKRRRRRHSRRRLLHRANPGPLPRRSPQQAMARHRQRRESQAAREGRARARQGEAPPAVTQPPAAKTDVAPAKPKAAEAKPARRPRLPPTATRRRCCAARPPPS